MAMRVSRLMVPPTRWRVIGVLVIAVCLLTLGPAGRASGAPSGWSPVVSGGFGEKNNGYLFSSVAFKGRLYATTEATPRTVYTGSTYSGTQLRRTEDGIHWEQVSGAGLGDPNNTSAFLAVFGHRLYAVTVNHVSGAEVFSSNDGTTFEQVAQGGFGDKENDYALPFVYQGKLLLGVSNTTRGAQIWVSEDGKRFRRVVDGGMGDPTNNGVSVMGDAAAAGRSLDFRGHLYVGTINPTHGGEIWRTADGLRWERVATGGLGRQGSVSLTPQLVFQNRLYASGEATGSLNSLQGVELFRTTDGTHWEKVVEDGFGVGPERNIFGFLQAFRGQLYLVTESMDPRILTPGHPSERHPPKGFQLRRSSDGTAWTQVGTDGFGSDATLLAAPSVERGQLYLAAVNYQQGDEVWRSPDGTSWDRIFSEGHASPYAEGAGVLLWSDHLLVTHNDIADGLDIWRQESVLSEASPTIKEKTTSQLDARRTPQPMPPAERAQAFPAARLAMLSPMSTTGMTS